jgi:uncharacterized protein (TIGR01244 family)
MMPSMKTTRYATWTLAILVLGVGAGLRAQQVTKPSVAGITNFARVETTIACGGSTKPEALAELKKMGFAAVFNMRMANEPDANIPAEEAAAKAVGLKFIHIPYNTQSPDPGIADKFLAEIQKPGNQPAYIHCAGGSRAAGMWLIKRIVVDKWDTDRAMKEATDLGLANERVKQYALDYVKTHK